MSTKLFVGNLPWSMDTGSLHGSFAQFGTVLDSVVPTDRVTGQSRGFGFVTYEKHEEAENAMKSMDGQTIDRREIRVKYANTQAEGNGAGNSNGNGSGTTNGPRNGGYRPSRNGIAGGFDAPNGNPNGYSGLGYGVTGYGGGFGGSYPAAGHAGYQSVPGGFVGVGPNGYAAAQGGYQGQTAGGYVGGYGAQAPAQGGVAGGYQAGEWRQGANGVNNAYGAPQSSGW